MFPTGRWQIPPSLGWRNPQFVGQQDFWLFSGIGTALNRRPHRPQDKPTDQKGRISNVAVSFTRTLIALAAALLMSTVAVGAAVAPAQANANPVEVSLNA